MKSFSQFCSESVYFTEMSDFVAGGGNAKMRETGMSRDQVIALGQKNLARLKNKSAAPAASPAPRPKDERPTVGQVQAAKREAEYQRNARNLRLGVELGGLAAQQARQNYATQNSPAVRAARSQMAAKNAGTWRTHPHTLNKKVGRGYGVPKLSDMLQDNSRSQLTDYYMKKGMSRADAEAKASREAQQIHDRNRADYRSGSGYD